MRLRVCSSLQHGTWRPGAPSRTLPCRVVACGVSVSSHPCRFVEAHCFLVVAHVWELTLGCVLWRLAAQGGAFFPFSAQSVAVARCGLPVALRAAVWRCRCTPAVVNYGHQRGASSNRRGRCDDPLERLRAVSYRRHRGAVCVFVCSVDRRGVVCCSVPCRCGPCHGMTFAVAPL